jgi:peptidoglycan hydrolase CwlO-like protein
MLDHTDDASTLLKKIADAYNDLKALRQRCAEVGAELNKIEGHFKHIKADIGIKKEEINVLKILIKAEGSHL